MGREYICGEMGVSCLYCVSDGPAGGGRNRAVTGSGRKGVATLCRELSESSRLRNRSGDVLGRGGCLRSCTHGDNFGGVRRFASSKCDKAGFGHPNFRSVVTRVRTKRVTAIVMGSVDHFKHGCLRIKFCARVRFPSGNIQFVTVGGGISDTGPASGSFAPFLGVVGR